jgi:hypothetical protein
MNVAAAAATTLGWSASAAPLLLRATRGAVRTAPARALPKSARAEAKLIDGKAIAADVRVGVADMKEKVGKVPGTSDPKPHALIVSIHSTPTPSHRPTLSRRDP